MEGDRWGEGGMATPARGKQGSACSLPSSSAPAPSLEAAYLQLLVGPN